MSNETAQYDGMALSPGETDALDQLVFEIAGKPKAERTAAEGAVLRASSMIQVLRGRIQNYAISYGNLEKELHRVQQERDHLRGAGEQQAEIIARGHDFCEKLTQAVSVAEAGLLIGEVKAIKCILQDARDALGLNDEEDDNV